MNRKGLAGVIAAIFIVAALVTGGALFAISGIEKDSHDFAVSVTESSGGCCAYPTGASNSETFYFSDFRELDSLVLSDLVVETDGSENCAFTSGSYGNPLALVWWDAYCLNNNRATRNVLVLNQNGAYTSPQNLACEEIEVVLNVKNNQLVCGLEGVTHRVTGTAKVVGPDVELIDEIEIENFRVGYNSRLPIEGYSYTCENDRCAVSWEIVNSGSTCSNYAPQPILKVGRSPQTDCAVDNTKCNGFYEKTIDLSYGETAYRCALINGGISGLDTYTISGNVKLYSAIGCGDGIVQEGEECDPPNSDTCSPECKIMVCGNGYKDFNEQCDDEPVMMAIDKMEINVARPVRLKSVETV